jgi:hypothetical protein
MQPTRRRPVGAVRLRLAEPPRATLTALLVVGSGVGSAAQPGQKLWEFQPGEVRSSPAGREDGTVYVGSCDQKLYALNGTTVCED